MAEEKYAVGSLWYDPAAQWTYKLYIIRRPGENEIRCWALTHGVLRRISVSIDSPVERRWERVA